MFARTKNRTPRGKKALKRWSKVRTAVKVTNSFAHGSEFQCMDLLRTPTEKRTDEQVDDIFKWLSQKQNKLYESLCPDKQLRDEYFREICRKAGLRTAKPNELVIKQGDHANCYFVVLRGQCIVKYNPNQQDIDDYDDFGPMVCTLSKGEGFGEVSLGSVGGRRTATVIASGETIYDGGQQVETQPTQLLSIDQDVYCRCILPSSNIEKKMAVLNSMFCFKHWPEKQKLRFSYLMTNRKINAGERLITANEQLNEFYIVQSGSFLLQYPSQKVQMSSSYVHKFKELDVMIQGPLGLLGIYGFAAEKKRLFEIDLLMKSAAANSAKSKETSSTSQQMKKANQQLVLLNSGVISSLTDAAMRHPLHATAVTNSVVFSVSLVGFMNLFRDILPPDECSKLPRMKYISMGSANSGTNAMMGSSKDNDKSKKKKVKTKASIMSSDAVAHALRPGGGGNSFWSKFEEETKSNAMENSQRTYTPNQVIAPLMELEPEIASGSRLLGATFRNDCKHLVRDLETTNTSRDYRQVGKVKRMKNDLRSIEYNYAKGQCNSDENYLAKEPPLLRNTYTLGEPSAKTKRSLRALADKFDAIEQKSKHLFASSTSSYSGPVHNRGAVAQMFAGFSKISAPNRALDGPESGSYTARRSSTNKRPIPSLGSFRRSNGNNTTNNKGSKSARNERISWDMMKYKAKNGEEIIKRKISLEGTQNPLMSPIKVSTKSNSNMKNNTTTATTTRIQAMKKKPIQPKAKKPSNSIMSPRKFISKFTKGGMDDNNDKESSSKKTKTKTKKTIKTSPVTRRSQGSESSTHGPIPTRRSMSLSAAVMARNASAVKAMEKAAGFDKLKDRFLLRSYNILQRHEMTVLNWTCSRLLLRHEFPRFKVPLTKSVQREVFYCDCCGLKGHSAKDTECPKAAEVLVYDEVDQSVEFVVRRCGSEADRKRRTSVRQVGSHRSSITLNPSAVAALGKMTLGDNKVRSRRNSSVSRSPSVSTSQQPNLGTSQMVSSESSGSILFAPSRNHSLANIAEIAAKARSPRPSASHPILPSSNSSVGSSQMAYTSDSSDNESVGESYIYKKSSLTKQSSSLRFESHKMVSISPIQASTPTPTETGQNSTQQNSDSNNSNNGTNSYNSNNNNNSARDNDDNGKDSNEFSLPESIASVIDAVNGSDSNNGHSLANENNNPVVPTEDISSESVISPQPLMSLPEKVELLIKPSIITKTAIEIEVLPNFKDLVSSNNSEDKTIGNDSVDHIDNNGEIPDSTPDQTEITSPPSPKLQEEVCSSDDFPIQKQKDNLNGTSPTNTLSKVSKSQFNEMQDLETMSSTANSPLITSSPTTTETANQSKTISEPRTPTETTTSIKTATTTDTDSFIRRSITPERMHRVLKVMASSQKQARKNSLSNKEQKEQNQKEFDDTYTDASSPAISRKLVIRPPPSNIDTSLVLTPKAPSSVGQFPRGKRQGRRHSMIALSSQVPQSAFPVSKPSQYGDKVLNLGAIARAVTPVNPHSKKDSDDNSPQKNNSSPTTSSITSQGLSRSLSQSKMTKISSLHPNSSRFSLARLKRRLVIDTDDGLDVDFLEQRTSRRSKDTEPSSVCSRSPQSALDSNKSLENAQRRFEQVLQAAGGECSKSDIRRTRRSSFLGFGNDPSSLVAIAGAPTSER